MPKGIRFLLSASKIPHWILQKINGFEEGNSLTIFGRKGMMVT